MPSNTNQTYGVCLHGPPTPEHPHGKLPEFRRAVRDKIKEGQLDARQRSKWPADRVGYPDKDNRCVVAMPTNPVALNKADGHSLCVFPDVGHIPKLIERGREVSELLKSCSSVVSKLAVRDLTFSHRITIYGTRSTV